MEQGEKQQLGQSLNRQIWALAAPSLGMIMAEPLLLSADTAMVGHLGTTPLAGLGLAAQILGALWGIFIFLTYTTTAAAARAAGQGREDLALRLGLSGMWLGALVGAVLAVVLWLGAPAMVGFFGARGAVAAAAVTYLRCSGAGLVGLLLFMAGTGALRGTFDARTPFYISAGGALFNVGANWVFMYPLGLGIAGSALGTALSQLGMAAALLAVVLPRARARRLPLRPVWAEIGDTWRQGAPLLVRSVALRACLLVTIAAATAAGEQTLAAHQVVAALYALFSYPADALAISAQTLVGHALGAQDQGRLRAVVRACLAWSLAMALVLGLILGLTGPLLAPLYTDSAQVAALSRGALWVVAVTLPLTGLVFCLDGVLIGAGRQRFLAWGMSLTFLCYVPSLYLGLYLVGGSFGRLADPAGSPLALVSIWASFTLAMMGVRALTNGYATWRLWRAQP